MKRWIRTLGLWLGYACLALIGLWLLAVGANSLPDAGAVGPFVLWGGFLAGAAFAVVGGLYELRSRGLNAFGDIGRPWTSLTNGV